MAALDMALNELDAHLNGKKFDLQVTPEKRAALVLESRRRILELVGTLQSELPTDEKFKLHPNVGKEFATKLAAFRRHLAGLQAKWRANVMVENIGGHETEGRAMTEDCRNLVRWAKAARAGL